MLAITQIENTESTVYTVPEDKTAYLYVDFYPLSADPSCTIKINDYIYWSGVLYGQLTVKLVLTTGDSLKVSANGQVNVFVYGIVV